MRNNHRGTVSCICARKFAPEGQLAPTGAFPPNKSARLSARSCVTSQVHEAILWAIVAPAGHRLKCFSQAPGASQGPSHKHE